MRAPLLPPEFRSWRMSDGYELRGRVWQPKTPRSDWGVLYLHGIQSHGGWFEWSASVLAAQGCPVLLADRRGSGLNAAGRGDTPSAERWLADLDELASWMARELRVAARAVVGVSWGGKLAVAWALRRPCQVARLLLVAPGVFPAVDVGLVQRVQIVGALLAAPGWRSPIPLSDPALFTDNPLGQRFIEADPLKLSRASARFLYESRRLDREVQRARRGALDVGSTTLLLAGRDRIIRNEPTVRWLAHICAAEPRVVTIPTAAHTIEFEPDVSAYEQALAGWAGS